VAGRQGKETIEAQGKGAVAINVAKDTTINTGPIYNVSQTGPIPEIAILDYARLFDRQLANISDQFVPLSVIADVPLPTMEVIPAHVFLRHDRAFEGPENESLAESLAMSGRSMRLSDTVDQQDAIVIRGDPGSGKTVSCEYLAQRACRAIIKDGWHAETSLLPVVISMHRFAIAGDEQPSDALARLVAYTLRQAGALPAEIESLSRHGRVYLEKARNESLPLLLCLDGLNEVAAGTVRDAAYDAINQLVTSLRSTKTKIVVTTRRYGFEAYRLGSLKIFDVQPLTEVQIKDYIARRVEIGQSEAATLFRQLSDKIRQHASNPLHLNLICEFAQRRISVPSNRAQLFKMFVEGVLERWENSKGYDFGQRNFAMKQKQAALEKLALAMQERGRNITIAKAQEIMHEGHGRNGSSTFSERLLDELCTNHILRKRHDGIEFIHQTFQEYFCAAALKASWEFGRTASSPERTDWFAHARSDQGWWEPLSMVAGLLDGAQLEQFLRDLDRTPILASMAISNAAPGSPIENRFIQRIKSRLSRQISAIQIMSQVMLWSVAGVFIVVAVVSLHEKPEIGSIALFKWLRTDYQHGFNPWWAFIISILLSAIVIGPAVALAGYTINYLHEKWLDWRISQRLDPLLLTLRYLIGSQAKKALDEVVDAINRSRWADPLLVQRLRTYSDRLLPTNPLELADLLNLPGMSGIALIVLTYQYELVVATELIDCLPKRMVFRQTGELKLYQAWIRRYKRAHDELIPLLKGKLEIEEWSFDLRRRTAKMLRDCGEEVPWVPGTLSHIAVKLVAAFDKICAAILLLISAPLFFLSIALPRHGQLAPLKMFSLGAAGSLFLVSPYGKSRWFGLALARSLGDVGDKTRVQSILQQLESKWPNDQQILEGLINAANDGEDQVILRWQLRLHEIVGEQPNILLGISRTYNRLGNYSQAEQFAMRSIEAGGNTEFLFVHAAVMMFWAGKRREAIEFLRDAAVGRFGSSAFVADYTRRMESDLAKAESANSS
jgi:hypothetical protein